MAYIVWNKGERSIIDAWLGGQGDSDLGGYSSPQLVPVGGNTPGSWAIGLGTRVGGVGGTKADTITQIIEVDNVGGGSSGYARQGITRDQTAGGWPAATLSGSSYASTAPQKSFSFTGAPNPNGATLWFLAGNTTLNADNCLFGADLAATRTFGNGDVERVTATYQQT